MTERARNVAIGLTVIVGLVLLGGLIVQFAGLRGPMHTGYTIRIRFPSACTAVEGDTVSLRGVEVGKIEEIRFTEDDPRKGVTFVVKIEDGTRLPGNVRAYILDKGLIGGVYVDLRADGPQRIDPATGEALDFLPPDYDQPIQGIVKTGIQIPEDLKKTLSEVSALAESLTSLIAPSEATTAPSQAASGPAPISLTNTVRTLNRALKGMANVFGDTENQKNLKVALANLAEATKGAADAMDALKAFAAEAKAATKGAEKTFQDVSDTARTTRKRIDKLAEKLIEDAERISEFMTSLNKTAAKIEAGKGTVGKLINDPKLYENLLDATRQLGELMKEFRQLVKLWKQQGVDLKLK